MLKKRLFKGLLRELNPGPLAPEARIIPLDQAADDFMMTATLALRFCHDLFVLSESHVTIQAFLRNKFNAIVLKLSSDCSMRATEPQDLSITRDTYWGYIATVARLTPEERVGNSNLFAPIVLSLKSHITSSPI